MNDYNNGLSKKPWEQKLFEVVSAISLECYRRANMKKDGTYFKKHRPYSIPPIADELVRISGMKDRQEAERLAKGIFIKLNNFATEKIVDEWM